MMKIFLIRHGKTDWNDKNIIQGLTNIDINEEGIKQAKVIARKIDIDEIDICISSPLKRAISTAEIIAKNKNIIYDDLLKERCFGDYEGQKISNELVYKHWNYKLNDNSNNVESIRNLLKRANKFLNKIKKKYPNKKILIVSHACVIKALHYNIVGYDKNTDFLSFYPENTKIYEYEL